MIGTVAGPASAASWSLQTVYAFCSQANCIDGKLPFVGVTVLDNGSPASLYGVTSQGGQARNGGTVFTLTEVVGEQVLNSFCSDESCTDGADPEGPVLRDGQGNLYGTVNQGGGHGAGLLYKLPSGSGGPQLLHTFCSLKNCRDGARPQGALVRDDDGDLYGTASQGGAHGNGVVFELTAAGEYKVVHSFCSASACADGANPMAGVILGGNGNLYGTTNTGGVHSYGTVFRIAPTGKEKVLYNFCAMQNCTDGYRPEYSGVVRDGHGNLYGTTYFGGDHDYGTVFKVTRDGQETVLYSFCSAPDCSDGRYPLGGLVRDRSGDLFGTTGGPGVHGVIYRVTSIGSYKRLYTFCSQSNCTDGYGAYGDLSLDASGNLYGTTSSGGQFGGGTVFKVTKQ